MSEDNTLPDPVLQPRPAKTLRSELRARLLSAGFSIVVVATLLLAISLMGIQSLARLFAGGDAMTVWGVVVIAGLAAVVALLLALAFHTAARGLVDNSARISPLGSLQRDFLESLPCPAFFLNSDAVVADLNSKFAAALNRSSGNVAGKNFYDFIPEDHRDHMYRGLNDAFSGEGDGIRSPVIVGGGTRTFLILAAPYTGMGAGGEHIFAVAKDISDLIAESGIQNEKYENLKSATTRLAEAIVGIVELRDPYLRDHHNRVGELARKISRQLNLSEEESEGIELAARLHDIGTLTIPFEIMVRPGRLSAAEEEIVRQHAQAGYDILSKVDFAWPVAEMILEHHEDYDGSGYPNGLKGSNISIGARIIAVADSYDAMTSDRPFRAAVSMNEALNRISNLSGKQYDPDIVMALYKAVQPDS